MRKKRTQFRLHNLKHLAMISLILLLIASCNQGNKKEDKISGLEVKGSVHSINLEYHDPNFSDQEGKDLFVANCTICHTLRYISMQPDFPRKTWKAEVTKMVEKFGAPILPENAEKIVNYLNKIKGKDIAKK